MTFLSLDSIAIPDLHPDAPLVSRKAKLSDLDAIHELIGYWAARGQMLVRSRSLLAETIRDFHLIFAEPHADRPGGLVGGLVAAPLAVAGGVAFFGLLGTVLLLLGLIPFVRFLVLLAMGDGGGHVQSLIFGTALLVGALFSYALLIIADLQRTNRVLMEETLEQLRLLRFGDQRGDLRDDDA